MNEEREDTELAELLKQLPAPQRLDDARRAAIFASLPQGRKPYAKTRAWGRIVSFAALLVIVVGGLAGLLYPVFQGPSLRSMSIGEKSADSGYCVDVDAQVEAPSDAPIDTLKSLEDARTGSGAQNGDLMPGADLEPAPDAMQAPAAVSAPAPPPVSAPATAEPAKPAAFFGVSDSSTGLILEKKREGDGRMDSGALGRAPAERSPDLALPEAPPPSATPRPAEIQSVAIVKSPIGMRGLVGKRSAGQGGKALHHLARMEESTSAENAPGAGEETASAADSEPLPEPEMADKAEAVGMDGLAIHVAFGAKPARPAVVDPNRIEVSRRLKSQSAEAVELPREEAEKEAQLVADAPSPDVGYAYASAGGSHAGAEGSEVSAAIPGKDGAELIGRLRYTRSDLSEIAEEPADAAMQVEAQSRLASDRGAKVAQDPAQAVDSDDYVYYTAGTSFKAKRRAAPEGQWKGEGQEEQLASTARKADEALRNEPIQATLVMEKRESEVVEVSKLATLENARREILDEYRDVRKRDLAKELPGVGSEAEDGADKAVQENVLVEEMKEIDANVLVEEMKEIEEKPAPVDFGPFKLIPTAEHPLSTFGLDVDSAGYSRAVSLINAGARPEPTAIRQEEFINAFDYGDLAPAEATFRVYLEGAASPFRPGNHLLRVGVKGRRLGREEQRPLRLTILLDASGSMETPERMALAKQAVRALLATLSPDDAVTLLTCSDRTRRIFSRSGWGTDEAALEAGTALGGIRCQGATNLEDGIVRAFESASADFAPKAENRVVILSDGIANLGSANAEEILAKVAANRDRGINCSVIGVGRSTYNDALLEAMANRGNGQYRFLDSEASIHESFVADLQNSFNTIAADVKIQVEWNSAAVQAYRSHGYDSRALKDEQFRDDSVDAGEVGSGQGVTVVYEMQLAEGLKPAATLGTVRIRYRRIDTGAVEEIEAPIAAEAVMRDFAGTRPQFRLACAVAEFATALKHVLPAAQANALQRVAQEADRAAAELNYYAPARGFADAVRKLMGIGL